ncbi:unnamed protein product [Bemisia tabaci]|uniref:Uncharacterized protein n=1 Tax=Bemisia tabaci TaxID=7038 RepID=A0A9N9ZYK3_BEMTA|nr:unnamed protein product [Bemisia tabaci]
MRTFLENERAIAAAAVEGLNAASRGRVHEKLSPFREQAKSDSRNTRVEEVRGLIDVAGTLFAGPGRPLFTGYDKRGSFSSYHDDRGVRKSSSMTGLSMQSIYEYAIIIMLASRNPKLAKQRNEEKEEQPRADTPDLSLYGLDAQLSAMPTQTRAEAEIEAAGCKDLRTQGFYYVKIKNKKGKRYIEDVRNMRAWCKLLRPQMYDRFKQLGWLDTDNEEKGLHAIVRDLTKVEVLLYFKLLNIIPGRSNKKSSPAASVASHLNIGAEQLRKL